MDTIDRILDQYLEKYAHDLDVQTKTSIAISAKEKLIRNMDDKIASALPESKVAQLLVLLEEGSPSDSEVKSFIE